MLVQPLTTQLWGSSGSHLQLQHARLYCIEVRYSGFRITESLGNVTVRGEERWKEQGGKAIVNSLSEHV
jgi:hypothetical protein